MGYFEPGGRLPMTFPARPEDAAVLDPAPDDPNTGAWHYREGLFVGYRHFDRYEREPSYCFGHGLGYTRFDYEELRVGRNGDQVEVSVRIRNRGGRRGKEVVQLYVSSEDPGRPPLELTAFERIDLDPDEASTLTFALGERHFSRYDSEAGRFALIPGRHEIAVGSSSRDLRLRKNVTFAAEPSVSPGPART
jgi:beta-glucosidase